MGKQILDVTSGSRMMWFDKKNPNAIFTDSRKEVHTLCDGRILDVNPDIVMDFRNLEFPNSTFHLVVFDPPHLKVLGKTSWMAKKYGVLTKDWRSDIKNGFNECWRVLKPNGVLIFKWNENDIKLAEILKLFPVKPLFGHPTGRKGLTHWMTFMKLIPNTK